jgi:hypothetical protein
MEYTIKERVIYGGSFCASLDNIEFITWRLNEDTGEYWVKFHMPSSKEIRIKVDEIDLQLIVEEWSLEEGLELKLGGEYGLD